MLPLYLAALGWQFLHSAEEYVTGFNEELPAPVDGSAAYPLDTFVAFNVVAYCAFALATVALLQGRPVGNAIAHLVLGVLDGGYFPDLYTTLGYLVLGPPLIRCLFEADAPSPSSASLSRRSGQRATSRNQPDACG